MGCCAAPRGTSRSPHDWEDSLCWFGLVFHFPHVGVCVCVCVRASRVAPGFYNQDLRFDARVLSVVYRMRDCK